MKRSRTDGQETRQRLLAAASKCFAEKGFWETTNADICKEAGVNTASVNYHFSSKDNLYIESWKYSFGISMSKYPPDGGVSPEAPAEERLSGRILAIMQRIGDPKNHDIEIIHKEMANPTGLLTEIIHKTMEPVDESIKCIVCELLGSAATEQEVRFCQMSIMSQCFGPMLHLRRIRETPDGSHPKSLSWKFDEEMLAEHVTKFSLAGIHAACDEAEKRRKSSRKST
jgi:AcrR family transcriptional regulator